MADKKLSIILIDWNVRESFHSVEYLNNQSIPRGDYELIWVEYYNHRPQQLQEYFDKGYLDRWIVLEKEDMYSKHQCYNEGIAASKGDIISICDSDAIFSNRYVEEVLSTFRKHDHENIVLYFDQVRNDNPVFYPFKHVSIETIMKTPGLINWDERLKKTVGLTTNHDTLHYRNYGAAICIKREEVIKAGGYDEHESYHCFMCGPYELGWRLLNKGFKEVWHESEWLYHVWHPWIKDGVDIYGPHDDRGLNATAVEAWKTGRIEPLQENPKIQETRLEEFVGERVFQKSPDSLQIFRISEARTVRPRIKAEPIKHHFINRALIIMEHAEDRYDTGKILRGTGLIQHVGVYNYDIEFHKYGQERMERRLVEVCDYFKPDFIIYIPLRNRNSLLPNEFVEPRKEVIADLAKCSTLYVHSLSTEEQVREWLPYGKQVGIESASVYAKYKSNKRAIFVYPDVDACSFTSDETEKDIDVLYFGSLPSNSRKHRIIHYLRNHGIHVHTRLHRFLEPDYIEVINRSKICINFGDPEKVSRRALEVLACGSLLVSEHDSLLEEMFVPDEGTVYFKDEHELLSKIVYYLKHDSERNAIARAGYREMFDKRTASHIWLQIVAACGYSSRFDTAAQYANLGKTAIFGTGISGEMAHMQAIHENVEITGFIDNFPPADHRFLGLPVYEPQEFMDNHLREVDTVWLASAGRKVDMLQQLLELGYQKKFAM